MNCFFFYNNVGLIEYCDVIIVGISMYNYKCFGGNNVV